MAFEQKDIDALNTNIKAWDEKNLYDVRKEMDALGIKHRKGSPSKISAKRSLSSKLTQRSGLTNRISYSMPRHMVFVHKGVSRGHPKTNPRTAKEFFNPVVNKNLEELADIVADGQGTLVINALIIK